VKAFAVVLLFGTSVFAQESSSPIATAPGCGAALVKFDVKMDKSPHALLQPPPGQAIVYFLEDYTEFVFFVCGRSGRASLVRELAVAGGDWRTRYECLASRRPLSASHPR
jgi:hypothetical protein